MSDRRRTGKIASLDFECRTAFNKKIRDGVKSAPLIKWLESKDVFGVSDMNISNWVQGGYQDWLKEQGRLEDMKARREFAMEIVKQNEGSKLQEATLHLAASQLYEVITDFDITRLKDLLKEEPENYAAIVNSLAKLSKGALEIEKYKAAVTRARDEIQKLRDPKQAMTDDDRKAIVDKVDEILGIK